MAAPIRSACWPFCHALVGVPICGWYVLNAYDDHGKPINPGYAFLAHGRIVYSAINGTCLDYPSARVVVIDKETGREATDLSPHQCRK